MADSVVGATTDLGSVFALAGASAALAATGRRRQAAEVAGAGMVAWTAAQAAKQFGERPRPYQADGVARLVAEPAGSSWPSGHAAVAVAVCAALGPHLSRTAHRAAGALAGFVALSRVYVGVHYLSDVVAGVAIGGWSAALWRGARRLLWRGSRRRQAGS